ncbi:Phospholipid-transporting ATPase 10, partial [Asimina triloba]
VTRLVKDYTGKTSLAFGDSANDVGMIQAADFGIGISRMEGMHRIVESVGEGVSELKQATMSSR